MKTSMLDDIQGQPESLRRVTAYQFGDGEAALLSAAAAIRKARRVVFAGMGSSLYAAIPAAAYLTSRGFPAITVEASELLHFSSASAHDDAVLVLVSRSGETIEIKMLLERFGKRRNAIIGVTNERASHLDRNAGISVLVNSLSDRMIAVQTYTGTLTVLLLLASAVLEESIGVDVMNQVIDAVSGSIENALTQRGDWDQFLADAQVVYLLGRGPSLASVYEGALLMNEAARLPSVAMSAAEFRHGPAEIVDTNFRAIVFVSQEQTRELDRALASDLNSIGGSIRVCDGLRCPAPFEPISEIIPVQVAACSLALHRGIDPGAFRYSAQVTSAETGFQKP